MPPKAAPHRVAFLVYDGVTLLDVAGPAAAYQPLQPNPSPLNGE